MAPKPTLPRMKQAAYQIYSCKDITDVESLLEEPQRQLILHSFEPDYYTFEVRKSSGKMRTIEAPKPALKSILRKLNFYLQCAYYFVKPYASYGYILSPKHDPLPRNILTHAELHLHCKYMLNVDFKDFFHQVSKEQVRKILESHPFRFSKSVANTLAKLCTYKGRLPMGSPTSPVLSNFAAIPLDHAVWEWALGRQYTYSRFVDDISLSSDVPLAEPELWEITALCKQHHFRLNPGKTKFYGIDDPKIVTGLIVGSKITVPVEFYAVLDKDLDRLKKTIETSVMMEGSRTSEVVKRYKQQVHGKVNFIGMIRGYRDKKYLHYMQAYEEAIAPNIEKLSMRWMDFPYF